MFRKVIHEVLAAWGSLTWGGWAPPYVINPGYPSSGNEHPGS
jgi:hypothetical protein